MSMFSEDAVIFELGLNTMVLIHGVEEPMASWWTRSKVGVGGQETVFKGLCHLSDLLTPSRSQLPSFLALLIRALL